MVGLVSLGPPYGLYRRTHCGIRPDGRARTAQAARIRRSLSAVSSLLLQECYDILGSMCDARLGFQRVVGRGQSRSCPHRKRRGWPGKSFRFSPRRGALANIAKDSRNR